MMQINSISYDISLIALSDLEKKENGIYTCTDSREEGSRAVVNGVSINLPSIRQKCF